MADDRRALLTLVLAVYLFILGVELVGEVFKAAGGSWSERLIASTTNPFAAFFVGLVATAIVQSSSATTSLVVVMVGGGQMTLRNAIFIIMGANIGTTVTNTIVALGHMGNPQDFRRAFAAGTVHDFFNILTAATLFPIEYRYRVLERGATVLASWVRASGGLRLASPLDYVVKPVVGLLEGQLPFWLLALSSLACLFLALVVITMAMRTLVVERLQRTIDRYLFRSPGSAFLVGLVLTGVVQSSSVTTSLVVPLAGAGIVALEMVFPYTLGANIGTTVTAFLAAIVTGQELAVTASLCHTLFNVLGCCVWYPLRAAPLGLARGLADLAASNRKLAIAYIVVVFYLVPGVLILALR